MKHISLGRRFWVLVSCLSITLALNPQAASGASRQITLPTTFGGIIGGPGGVAFAHNGVVGLVLGGSVGTPIRLASFTVSAAAIADDLVLDDFPPALPSESTARGMAVNDKSGLAAIFGNGANETQTVVAVSADVSGKLTKRWAISHPNPIGGQGDEAAINADGSIVYFFYNDSSPKVDKIRAEDGAVLGTIHLDDFDIEAGLTYNPALRRLIVKTGRFFHVLKPEPDFAVDWRLPFAEELEGVRQLVVSADGRFLIGYAGYAVGFATANKANVFMTLNMESREIHILSLKSQILPSVVALTFAPSIAALIVPYSSTVTVKAGKIAGCACGTQVADWLALGPDGTLTRSFTTQLAGEQQVIGPLNNAAFSRTEALAFLATMTKRLVAVDTLTGEVVSDQEVGDLFFIYRIGDTDTFLSTNGTNVLNLLDLNPGPSIHSIKTKKRKLIIEGENLLSGVQVQINGVDVSEVSRNPALPGREITVRVGKRDFDPGQNISVVVVNRDGLRSVPFTVNR